MNGKIKHSAAFCSFNKKFLDFNSVYYDDEDEIMNLNEDDDQDYYYDDGEDDEAEGLVPNDYAIAPGQVTDDDYENAYEDYEDIDDEK